MPSYIHRHDDTDAPQASGDGCCGGSRSCGNVAPVTPAPYAGRSFQVSGLDCAEEVAILNKVVGPKIGGAEHLAFDVINGRMTILDSAMKVSDGEVAELVASTGMTAKPWDAENASVDQAAHLARQRLFTALSGGFWAAGFLWHIIETGMGGAFGLFAGHGEAPMPLVEAGLFAVAILFGVWLVAPKAWSSARRLSPDMNLLMVVAVAGALGVRLSGPRVYGERVAQEPWLNAGARDPGAVDLVKALVLYIRAMVICAAALAVIAVGEI